ncbi:MAG: glycosyltransferase family 4 protein [Geminocystis sp.]|nr:glycosyltransferase family 4 protein [Geminocystis sp.]HIK38764.1 glycosyltransferase family 4 protein [Geminocystis sp. M7585_C2015_104]MCS7147887.1 glycosyltransferase family 4 protein [Geminocystis sp.]MCX8078713.1 glycosyltransferase family 4 protein [Geminocystis sp.]MDW8117025.1 glycosyltransferase family 4 protein [Geminocystis sp.]
MRVTFVLPNWEGNLAGGIRANVTLAYHLQKRGHEVQLYCPKKRSPGWKQRIKNWLKGKGWNGRQTRFSYVEEVDIPAIVVNHLPPLRDEDLPDADVVVATWWETAEWVAGLSRSKGAKVYMVRHHEVHDYLPKERAAATYGLPLHKVTVSRWLVEVMRREYGDENVDLVPDAVDLRQFYAPPRGKNEIPTVGLMYSDIYWKGCDISLTAFRIAAERIPSLRLVAFGTIPPLPRLPLPTKCVYYRLPPQDEIRNIYAQCDAWLFGSRVEGFGLPILEAMACRTPVIGTPAGAAPELLSKGGGILVKPENPEDMARAIEEIVQMSQQEWQKMSSLAYKTATSYTWDEAAELFEKALCRAIERTRKGEI